MAEVNAILNVIELSEYVTHSFLQKLSRENKIVNSTISRIFDIKESLKKVPAID